MDKRRYISPAQAQSLLNVSPSTLRAWSVSFSNHLSEEARGGQASTEKGGRRKRSYSPDDVAVLRRAGELLATGRKPSEVNALLGLTDASAPGAALVTMPTIAGDVVAVREMADRLHGEVEALAGEMERLRSEVGVFFERQARARQAQAIDLADLRRQLDEQGAMLAAMQRRGFWDRLLNRPPKGTI